MAGNIELQISKVANGYLVSVVGGKIAEETMSLIPALSETRRVHNFVFTDIYEMFVFLHHLMEPPKEGVMVHDGKIKPSGYTNNEMLDKFELRAAIESFAFAKYFPKK